MNKALYDRNFDEDFAKADVYSAAVHAAIVIGLDINGVYTWDVNKILSTVATWSVEDCERWLNEMELDGTEEDISKAN